MDKRYESIKYEVDSKRKKLILYPQSTKQAEAMEKVIDTKMILGYDLVIFSKPEFFEFWINFVVDNMIRDYTHLFYFYLHPKWNDRIEFRFNHVMAQFYMDMNAALRKVEKAINNSVKEYQRAFKAKWNWMQADVHNGSNKILQNLINWR